MIPSSSPLHQLVPFIMLFLAGNYNSYVHETLAEVPSEVPSLSSVAMPRFSNEKNVTVFTYTGANTHIDCAVDNLGQDTVISWVRRRDLHILTIATITYTADRRFSCSHSEDSSVWRLAIQSAAPTDSAEGGLLNNWLHSTLQPPQYCILGVYECQMSTEPKISKLFLLNVTDATSKIQAGPSVYVKEGSVLNLTCIFSGHVNPASHIYWYHNTKLLNTAVRGGISIVSDKVSGWSNLILSFTSISDSGNYSCEPSNARHHTVQVNIIKDGDLAAGGLTGSGALSSCLLTSWHHLALSLLAPLLLSL